MCRIVPRLIPCEILWVRGPQRLIARENRVANSAGDLEASLECIEWWRIDAEDCWALLSYVEENKYKEKERVQVAPGLLDQGVSLLPAPRSPVVIRIAGILRQHVRACLVGVYMGSSACRSCPSTSLSRHHLHRSRREVVQGRALQKGDHNMGSVVVWSSGPWFGGCFQCLARSCEAWQILKRIKALI